MTSPELSSIDASEPERPTPELVSVVIPAYNASSYIADAVRSALCQSHSNIEVIVVDDGSRDETPAIVAKLAKHDRRLQLVCQPNGGVASARNTGIAYSKARFVAFLDADDIWHPDKIARQMQLMRNGSSDLGLVYCRYRDIDDEGRVTGYPTHPPYHGDVFAALVLFNFVGGGSAALIRRSCLEEIGGFDESLRAKGAQGSEDTKLFLAIAERCDFGFVPEFLVGYRRTAGSMSQDSSQMLRSRAHALAGVQQRHPELPRKLFRWARGECCAWLAEEAFYGGRPVTGALMLLRTILQDPAAAIRPRTMAAMRSGLRRTLRSTQSLGWAVRIVEQYRCRDSEFGEDKEPTVLGKLFLEVPPSVGVKPNMDLHFASIQHLRFEARRQALVSAWRIKRRGIPEISSSRLMPQPSTGGQRAEEA